MSVKQPFGSDAILNTLNIGAGESYVTVIEEGDSIKHRTTLNFTTTLPAIAGGANLAVGKKLYTLPAGVQVIKSTYMSAAITSSQAHIDADTPDVGIGTVIASGAIAVLGGTATFENILTGQTAADCNGTATKAAVATTLAIGASDAKTIYLNVADGWAASGDAAAVLTGTVIIEWTSLV